MSHYGTFLPSLHQIKAPLNKLLAKDTEGSWPIDYEKAFDKIKTMLNLGVLLTNYDPSQKIVVVADA